MANHLQFIALDDIPIEEYLFSDEQAGETDMTYSVTWCLVGDDERCLDTDVFPETFSSYEEAVAFVLSRIDQSPSFGYDRVRRFWWLRAAGLSTVETRFCIMGRPLTDMQSPIACAAL